MISLFLHLLSSCFTKEHQGNHFSLPLGSGLLLLDIIYLNFNNQVKKIKSKITLT